MCGGWRLVRSQVVERAVAMGSQRWRTGPRRGECRADGPKVGGGGCRYPLFLLGALVADGRGGVGVIWLMGVEA